MCTQTTYTKPAIGRCRKCKRAVRADATVTRTETPTRNHATGQPGFPRVTVKVSGLYVECCGRPMSFDLIRGTVTEQKCDARCTNAKGHSCECSCGGANHGRAYA